ncbi:sugar ABC transporter substrate-binding protein [Allostreptomyces psammosilenae]|uniref:Multiple sugar transport system substrate-binding protein n=1 Tax=Allostreptomyces psammosilenae TaxID=1892865 RepID=A0A852ZZB3_9ACTN|nr:extracellular solute-binding protein [Allostreptomyces psammosilenae]NYI07676.1 multiple sugar transport system substrate-binding protein [Allostreptomyces psammosilenae]
MRPSLPPPRRARPLRAVGSCAAALMLTTVGGCGFITAETGPNTLTVADYYVDEPGNTALNSLLDTCGARAGVEIQRETMPRAQIVPKLLRDAAARSLPDLVVTDNPDLASLASTGALLPLDDRIDTSAFYESVLAAGSYQDTLYGIAPGINGLALFYDRELFAEAGLEPPTTWDELRETARRLTDGTRYGLALSAVSTEEGTWQFEPFLWGNGGELTDLDAPESVEALTYWNSLFQDGSVSTSALNWSQSDVTEQFIGGHAAMMVNGSWNLSHLATVDGPDYGIVPLPVPEAGGRPASPMGGEVWAVPDHGGGPKQEAALAVLECVLDDDNMYEWAAQRTDVATKPAVAERLVRQIPELAPFVASAPSARARTDVLGTRYPAVSAALNAAMQHVVTGGRTPEEALAAAQREAETADE